MDQQIGRLLVQCLMKCLFCSIDIVFFEQFNTEVSARRDVVRIDFQCFFERLNHIGISTHILIDVGLSQSKVALGTFWLSIDSVLETHTRGFWIASSYACIALL